MYLFVKGFIRKIKREHTSEREYEVWKDCRDEREKDALIL